MSKDMEFMADMLEQQVDLLKQIDMDEVAMQAAIRARQLRVIAVLEAEI